MADLVTLSRALTENGYGEMTKHNMFPKLSETRINILYAVVRSTSQEQRLMRNLATVLNPSGSTLSSHVAILESNGFVRRVRGRFNKASVFVELVPPESSSEVPGGELPLGPF